MINQNKPVEFYTVYVRCSNCGIDTKQETNFTPTNDDSITTKEMPIILEIPKGTKLKQFVSNTKCPECGCVNCLERK